MSKALVIKGANFAVNAVTTITFDEDIPCTDISFSSDTITIEGYDPVTVGYTLTPADTTDEVLWVSSDETVVSVEYGTLTVEGIGTCTITATCGSHSASATVTVAVEYIPNYVFGTVSITGSNGAGTLGGDTNRIRISAIGSGEQQTTYKLANTSDMTGDNYAILLPKNTAYIRLSFADLSNVYSGTYARIAWYKNENVGEGTLADYIKILAESGEQYDPTTSTVHTVAVPEGAEAFAFAYRIKSSGESTAEQVITAAGFSLEFLTEEDVNN